MNSESLGMNRKSIRKYLYFLVLILALIVVYLFLDYTSKPRNVLGQFTTTLNGRSKSQINNIIKVLKKLDGVVLDKEGTFSFNSNIGKCKEEYDFAPMIVDGRVENSLGGGICQVSSTLYNAVLLAGLEVTERHPHSYKINSVPPGLDATVAYGKADLEFKNNLSFPVFIKTKLLKNRILVKIMGKDPLPYSVKISRNIQKTIIVGQMNKNQKDQQLRSGVIVEVERKFYKGKELVKKELVSLDTYCL